MNADGGGGGGGGGGGDGLYAAMEQGADEPILQPIRTGGGETVATGGAEVEEAYAGFEENDNC